MTGASAGDVRPEAAGEVDCHVHDGVDLAACRLLQCEVIDSPSLTWAEPYHRWLVAGDR